MKSLRQNVIFGFLGFVIPTIALFASYPLLIKALGTSAFGVYFLATSFGGILAFLDFGLSAATVRFVAEARSRDNWFDIEDIISASFKFYTIIGVLGGIILTVLAPWMAITFGGALLDKAAAVSVFRWGALQFAVGFPTIVWVALFKGLQRFDQVMLLQSMQSVLGFVIPAVISIFVKIDVVTVSMLSFTASVISFGMGLHLARKFTSFKISRLISIGNQFSVYYKLVTYGSFFLINGIAAIALFHVQRYMIGAFVSATAVTVSQLAFTVPSRVHMLIAAITEMLFPIASGNVDKKSLRQLYMKMLIGSAFLGATMLVPLWWFGYPLLMLWVGDPLANQVFALMLPLLFAFYLMSLSAAPYHILNGIGLAKFNTLSYAFNAVLNLAAIGIFSRDGLTVEDFVSAFVIANVINALLYQFIIEFLVWRRELIWNGARELS
jgi:O-antigen/teichoic acid export membrane protein